MVIATMMIMTVVSRGMKREGWQTIRGGHDSTFCLTDHSQGEDDGDDDDDDDTDGDGNNDDDDYGEEVGGLGRGRRPVVSSAGRSLQTAAIGRGGCTLKSQKRWNDKSSHILNNPNCWKFAPIKPLKCGACIVQQQEEVHIQKQEEQCTVQNQKRLSNSSNPGIR